jgi:hypothetical protein
MKNPIQFFKILLPILLLCGIFSCKEEIIIDNTDDGFPLTLRIEVNDETPTFSWDATRVSNFDSYTLVRSEFPIPSGQKPGFGNTFVIMKTTNVDSLSVDDVSTPFVSELHYKLYADIGGRFIESQSVLVKQDLTKLPFSADLLHFIPDTSLVVILTANQIKLTLYDYKEKKIVSTKTIGGSVNIGDAAITDAVENGKRIIYYFNPYDKLYKFDLADFTQIKTNAVITNCFSMVSNANQVYSTHYDYDKSFSVRRITDLFTTKNTPRSNYYDRRLLVVIDQATNRIAEISPSGISAFNINASTSQASNTSNINFTSFGSQQNLNVPQSSDKKYFIPKSDGQVFNNNLEAVTQPLVLNSALDYTFSADGKFLYSLSLDFNFQSGIITKFNFPEMTLVSEKVIPGVSPKRIFKIDGGVEFFGIDFNQTSTFVKKVKL